MVSDEWRARSATYPQNGRIQKHAVALLGEKGGGHAT
jgi:hypothetical protein